ncbi:MAG: DNA polymerase III subunit beta, partial [Deltaproteobacteria bacterium]|nr:DNA polymerase III subunit beta [Deltaproteobacteria bacterium]MAZ75517.1 DNA polymerase III subunit beta [Deltaproteobacteria bacterium]
MTERDTEVIIETLATFEEIEEAVIFGSRAMG